MATTDRYVLKPLTNDGKRGFRLEIDEFVADNEMTNLFLIALSELQQDSLRMLTDSDGNDAPDWLTYYSLSGIHGQPRDNWDGVPNTDAIGYTGYCNHGENTFPTWHRPYVMLYEAAIHDKMVEVAGRYSDDIVKKTYLDAAARFRLPYWDIVMPRRNPGRSDSASKMWACPEILKAENVYVKLPVKRRNDPPGDFSVISNPLFTFSFPTEQDFGDHPERKPLVQDGEYNSVQTTRNPTFASGGKTDSLQFDLAIQRQAPASAVSFWQALHPDYRQTSDDGRQTILINQQRSWESFANHRYNAPRGSPAKLVERIGGRSYTTMSLESFHDFIHGTVGGGRDGWAGQMGDPAVAAFDPIFWLHHNNVDRMLSLYQALNPERYVGSDDIDKPLYPFEKDANKNFFTSNDDLVKNYWAPGYAIPGAEQMDKDAVREKVKEYITNTYLWAQVPKAQLRAGALPSWPKNMETCWALHGTEAKPATAMINMSALTLSHGVPAIVERAVPVHGKAMKIQDKVIDTSTVLAKAQALDAHLPTGALQTPVTEEKPAVTTTWNAHVSVRKWAFDGPFTIHLFIGYVKDDQPERFLTKKNEAGLTHVFASRVRDNCKNCAILRSQDLIYGDVVPLTTTLYDYLDSEPGSGDLIRDGVKKTIANLEPHEVVPFLKEHLQWRILKPGAVLVSGQEREAGLEVKVTSRPFESPSEEHVQGFYGPITEYADATSGRPGGYGYAYPA